MNQLRSALRALLRGPAACRMLERFGIDARRFWLMMDLFGELAERGEMMDQLGRNGVALDAAMKLYFFLSAIMSGLLVFGHAAPSSYLITFLGFTAFLLTTVLLSEAGNSLVNPTEGLVLAHQPINGATYTAAKLSHLLRIVLGLVPAVNAAPAVAGLLLAGTSWAYPVIHLGAALAIGLAVALLCCAVFGWLVRFVPVQRLKAAGQFASTLPVLGMMWFGQIERIASRLEYGRWLPSSPAARMGLAAGAVAAALAGVALGIRSLSADYLIRVSGMVRGGAHGGSGSRRSVLGEIVARYFGGQTARGGFAYTGRLMLRDWQFRRQLAPIAAPLLLTLLPAVTKGWPRDPFGPGFAPIHLLPHSMGVLVYFMTSLLPYGNDYKGSWVFLLFPSRVWHGFARGIHALLWIELVAIPHLVLLAVLPWRWGLADTGVFLGYSLAVSSIYLAVEVRGIEGVPFSTPMDPARGASSMGIVMVGAIVVGAAVGVQYLLFLLGRAAVAAVAVGLGIGAYYWTRASVRAYAATMQYRLGLVAAEGGKLYREVEV